MTDGGDEAAGQKPEKAAGVQDTRFQPGQSGNPSGKPRGTRHRITIAVEALLEGQHEALTQKAIEKALSGDTIALRLCLDRIAPARRDAAIKMDLPQVRTAADAVEAGTIVMEALANGDATPDEAARVMAILSAQKQLIETCDLEARIVELERGNAK